MREAFADARLPALIQVNARLVDAISISCARTR